MTAKTDDPFGYKRAMEEIMKDPVKRKEFMRKVMGPPRRKIEGDEYKHMMLVLGLKEPVSSSNNQRTWTDEYLHDGKTYNVTYFPGCDAAPELEEILPDD